ncbi:MAG: GspH/FimT family protein [Francisellaceae bacterium]
MNCKPYGEKKSKKMLTAFSLIELLVVLLLLAILVTMVSLMSHNSYADNKGRSYIKTLSAAVDLARVHAMSQGSAVIICPSATRQSCADISNDDWQDHEIIVFSSKDGSSDYDVNTDEMLLVLSSPQGSDHMYWHAFPNTNYVKIQADGFVTSSGSFIYCSNLSAVDTPVAGLIINSLGRTQLAEDENNNSIPENGSGNDMSCD